MIPQIVKQMLTNAGYSPGGVAGIMGNSAQESQFNPNAVGDSGNSYGLWQHSKDRKDALIQYASALNLPPSDPRVQTAFTINELQTKYPQLDQLLRSNVDPGRAAIAFGKIFERPNEQKANWENRVAYAQQIANGALPTAQPSAQTSQVPQRVIQQQQGDQNGQEIRQDANGKDAKEGLQTLLTINNVYDQSVADTVRNMARDAAVNQPIINDVMSKLHDMASGKEGQTSRLPGFKGSLADTMQLLDTMQQQGAPEEAIKQAKQDVFDSLIPQASATDYNLNQLRQLTGMSPEVAGKTVGGLAGGISALGSAVGGESPQQMQQAYQGTSQQVGSAVTNRFNQARANLPKGVDTAQGIVGGLASIPFGWETKAPILASAATGAIQGALGTENPTPQNMALNSAIGAGIGGTVGGVAKAGSALLSGITAPPAEKQAGDVLANAIATGAGTRGDVPASMQALQGVQQGFASRPDLPLMVQGAANSTYSTVAPKAAQDRAIQSVVQKAVSSDLDGPTANAVAQNLRTLSEVGGQARVNQMAQSVLKTNLNAGQVEQAVIPYMTRLGDAAARDLQKQVPTLSDTAMQQLNSTVSKSSAYQKALNEIRTSGLMQDQALANAPDNSVALQMRVRSVLNDWQHTQGGAFEKKLTPELNKMEDVLRSGTEVNGTSLWGRYNDTFADAYAVKRALDAGMDIGKASPEQITAQISKMSDQEQQAYAIGALQTVRDKFAQNGYKIANSFANPQMNEKVAAALNDPNATQKFLGWLGQEMQITNAVKGATGALNKTGDAMAQAAGSIGDPFLVASMMRGSFIYAYARALGDVMQAIATNKSTVSTEAKRLIAAYATSSDPEVQSKLVDMVRSSYLRDYTKGRAQAAVSSTVGNLGARAVDAQESDKQ